MMREAVIAAAPAATVPVIWSVLGYSFPAGSMCVGLLTCFMVRLLITLDAKGPKRWLDPLSVGCGFLWMALHMLAEPMIEHQLRKAPLPVDMWSRWPQLRRPALVLVVSLMMAGAAVGLR